MPATVNRIFRVVLLVWVFGYLAIACGPMLLGNGVVAGAGLLTGAVLLIPWLIGVLILVILVWLTNPRR
jgi:hypothetical protein